MGTLEKLELQLDDWLRKKAPYQLPENARRAVARSLWWIALVFGVLQLVAAWTLWRAADRVDELVDYANRISLYASGEPIQSLGFFFYLSLAILIIDGLIMLAAFQSLQQFKKQGWNLLFYSALLNLVAGLLMLFSDYGGGVGDFVRALLFSILGGYLLFQVREYFTGIKKAGDPVTVKHDGTVPPTPAASK